jgi:hypothetical protein
MLKSILKMEDSKMLDTDKGALRPPSGKIDPRHGYEKIDTHHG